MKKPGRNDPCPCGSGKKFKHCCLSNNALNAVQSVPANDAISSGKFLICESPGCLITIPVNLDYNHDQPYLCGTAICSTPNQPKWALCPQHAKEWTEKGHGCIDLQHYKLWKSGIDLTNMLDTSPRA